MTVTVQSSNLSSLAPKLQVYSAGLCLVGSASAPSTFGATTSVTACVQAGQKYYFQVLAAGGPAPIGAYGLLVNFGNQSQPPIPPPNTVVPQQPDQGGGTENDNAPPGGLTGLGLGCGDGNSFINSVFANIGGLGGWAQGMTYTPPTVAGNSYVDRAGDFGSWWVVPGSANVVSSIGIAALPSSNQNAPWFGFAPGSSTQATSTVNPAAAVTLGPASSVLQAIDNALDQLASNN
jgi:hypothetical protein